MRPFCILMAGFQNTFTTTHTALQMEMTYIMYCPRTQHATNTTSDAILLHWRKAHA